MPDYVAGEGIKNTEEEIRDAILTDATKFAGAYIAAIKAATDNLESSNLVTNLAEGLTPTTGGFDNTAMDDLENAVDGNDDTKTTRGTGSATHNGWLQIDLISPFLVKRIKYKYEGYCQATGGGGYILIDISYDGDVWKNISKLSAGEWVVRSGYLTVNALIRYVRIRTSCADGASTGLAVWTLEPEGRAL